MTDSPGDRASWRARRQLLFDLVPLALVIVAEASWIAIVGWLVQEYVLRTWILGIPEMAAFVAFGVVAARLLADRTGPRWPRLAVALVLAGGATGWLADASARDALGGGLTSALAAHPGGWLAAVAVLRGFAHARIPLSEPSVARLLGIGVPGLAVAGLLGGLIREPLRTDFLNQALGAAIVFVGTVVPALALTRLNAAGRAAGFDWRRNPAWTAVIVLLVAGALAAALPLTGAARFILELVFAVALLPMLLIGFTLGFDRTGKRILLFSAVVAAVVIILGRVFGTAPVPAVGPVAQPTGRATDTTNDPVLAFGIGGLVLAAAVVLVLVLAAAWMRRSRTDGDDDVFETRIIDRDIGTEGNGRRRRPWWQRRPPPNDAVAAYLAVIHDLERHPELRRRPTETPAEHARRFRSAVLATAAGRHLPLDLLAADYALDRFGGVALAPGEHRRAVGRWRSLRRNLPSRPG